MHISKLTLVNYRNFERTALVFNKGVNTVIGENGSGKSNAFRALRLLLDDNMLRAAHRMGQEDFHRGLGDWRGHWIIISVEFQELSQDEAVQALFVHGTGVVADGGITTATYNLIYRPRKEVRVRMAALDATDTIGFEAIRRGLTADDYETVFTGRSTADFSNEATYIALAGDMAFSTPPRESEFPDIGATIPRLLSVTREVSFTFIQALRDVVAEFHNNRTNPLLTLLKSKSGEIDPAALSPIVDAVRNLNSDIEALDDVKRVSADIRTTIDGAAGQTYSPARLSIRSALPEEADKLFQSLALFIGEHGESYEGSINELSLGGANLIYLTLKLLEFKYQKEKSTVANFLLIEEPEAHIHTHIQKTLFDRIAYTDTQIIYSTHSTQISEVSKIENVNVLGMRDRQCEAYQPASGLTPVEVDHVERYLDAVRSNLLFAKSVILVEGDAEEILVPVMVKQVMGVSLDELGISLVNIRSTGFENVSVLFHAARIRKRCAIVTDLDAPYIDTTAKPEDPTPLASFKRHCIKAAGIGTKRKARLDTAATGNDYVENFYADHTFEVDVWKAGNQEKIVAVLPKVYSDAATVELSRTELRSGDIAAAGMRIFRMAEYEGKGWLAIKLAAHIAPDTVIPAYIRDAVIFAHGQFSRNLIYTIVMHRARLLDKASATGVDGAGDLLALLESYRSSNMPFTKLKEYLVTKFPADQILPILDKMEAK